jgi:hypothetical protein
MITANSLQGNSILLKCPQEGGIENMASPCKKELFRACSVLFGPEVSTDGNFLFHVQETGVKSAYRERALLTHPDRLRHLGDEECRKKMSLFIEASWAYEQLMDFIRKKHLLRRPRARTPSGFSSSASAGPPPQGETCRSGRRRAARGSGSRPVPGRRLRLGQFLFFSGAISWQALIKAIVWQRRQRPRLGEIAQQWGWLREEQILTVAARRALGEPIGEAMARHGLLSRARLNILIIRQRQLQKALGEYFIQYGYFSKGTLDVLLEKFELHNSLIHRHSRF